MSAGAGQDAPELVRSRVAFTRRGLMSMRVLQALCLAVAAGLGTLAAGIHGGVELFDPGLHWLAFANALLVLVGCCVSSRETAQQVARRGDRALELEGALLTAWEAESRGDESSIARQLGRDVAARLPARKLLKAVLPNGVLFLVLPFVAVGLLLSVLDRARNAPDVRDLAELSRQVKGGLAAVSELGAQESAEGGEGLDSAEQEALRELVSRSSELSKRLEEGEASAEELGEFGQDLADFESQLRDSEEMSTELKRAMTSMDSARMALEGRERANGGGASEEQSSNPSGEAGSAGSEGTGLAPGGEDGRMSRQESPTDASDRPEREGRQEAGVLARPSWPEAHEGIIRRFLESSSTSRLPR